MTSWTIGQLATLTHISAKTLRHYHAISLLIPSRRSKSGYRIYSEKELKQLQIIRSLQAMELNAFIK